MRRDPATDGKSVKRTNKVVPVAISRRATENRKPNVQLPQIRRMYTVQVRVIDPEGQEILNLTKMAFEEDTNNIRKRDVLAVLPVDGDLRDGPYVSTIHSSGHDRSQQVRMSLLRSVDFVDVDTVDGGLGDGRVEAGEQLLEGFVLAPAKHGQGLSSL